MKKLDLNINLKEKEKEVKLDGEGLVCYEDRVNDAGETIKDKNGKAVKKQVMVDIEPCDSALKWIENSIIRVMNGTGIDGKPSKQPKLTEKAKWRQVSNALEAHEKGVVILEEADYEFLNKNFNAVEQIANTFVDNILLAILDAIKNAENYVPKLEVKTNPEATE